MQDLNYFVFFMLHRNQSSEFCHTDCTLHGFFFALVFQIRSHRNQSSEFRRNLYGFLRSLHVPTSKMSHGNLGNHGKIFLVA